MNNYWLYSRKDVVEKYSAAEKIQLPEATLIEMLWEKLQTFRVLDLWVWWGRTTLHFWDKVLEYIWTDFSEEMVQACKKRFQEKEKFSFKVVDASNLWEFENESFDFVLFSFNGIDYLDEQKRGESLSEAFRVLKKGGIFFFSTHNTQSIKNLFAVQKTYNVVKLLWRICRYFLLTFLNGKSHTLAKSSLVSLNDWSWGFWLTTVYISPKGQFSDLSKVWFHTIKAFSISDGKEIPSKFLETNEESRMYYYAEK